MEVRGQRTAAAQPDGHAGKRPDASAVLLHEYTHVERLSSAAGQMKVRLYNIAARADKVMDPAQTFVQRSETFLKGDICLITTS